MRTDRRWRKPLLNVERWMLNVGRCAFPAVEGSTSNTQHSTCNVQKPPGTRPSADVRCRPAEAELEQGEGADDQNQSPAYGGGVADVAGFEAGLEKIHDNRQGGVVGAGALEEDVGELEELEGADGADQDHEDQDGADAGDGDVPETGPVAGAVHLGGFVEVLIDRLEGGEEVDHAVADG